MAVTPMMCGRGDRVHDCGGDGEVTCILHPPPLPARVDLEEDELVVGGVSIRSIAA